MPHVILEYSDNLNTDPKNFVDLFKQLNAFLAEKLPADITACKSRAVACQHFCIADGQDKDKVFIHVNIKILSGRDEIHIKTVAQQVHKQLINYFANISSQKIMISVEISTIPDNYVK
ncbi:MAG: hypothetical protein CMF49_06465 [Legionellales bacterium]|nr:hypothetical protein [Legionellales bacterium]